MEKYEKFCVVAELVDGEMEPWLDYAGMTEAIKRSRELGYCSDVKNTFIIDQNGAVYDKNGHYVGEV